MRWVGKQVVRATALLFVLQAGTASAIIASDTTPDAFSFVDQVDVTLGASVTSAPVTITGIDAAATVTVTGGRYSVGCTGTWTSADGTITNGQTVCVQHTAPFASATTTDTTLVVGGVSDTFTSTTESLVLVPPDSDPDPFDFVDIDGVMPLAAVTSAAVTPTGFDSAMIWPENGEMDIDCDGTFESSGVGFYYVSPGTSVCVRHTAAKTCGTPTTTTLHVGSGSADFTTTTQTLADGCVNPPLLESGGGFTPWLVLAGLLLAGRRQRSLRRPAPRAPSP